MLSPDFIKTEPNFFLVIHFRDMLSFEHILTENNIRFFTEQNPPSGVSLKYYFAEADRAKIDVLIKENDIQAGSSTIPFADYNASIKSAKLYALITLVIAIIIAISTLL